MRLVNADDFILRFCHVPLVQEAIKKAMDCMPTIEERKKGKWVRSFDGKEWYWFCSNCKEEWYEEDLLMGGNDFPNFCPNCGADMKGGSDGKED